MSDFDDYLKESRMRARNRFIKERRVSSLTDEKFEGTGLRGDVSVKAKRDTVEVEPNTFLDDDFGTYKETVSEFSSYQPGPDGGSNVVQTDQIEDQLPPDPREVHNSRSERAQKQDERMDAPLTNDPGKYASNPDHYDFPGVDTPQDSKASRTSVLSDLRDLF